MKSTALALCAAFIGASAPAASPLDTYKQLARACVGGHVSPEEFDKDCNTMSNFANSLPKLGYCLSGSGGLWDWRLGKSDIYGKCESGN